MEIELSSILLDNSKIVLVIGLVEGKYIGIISENEIIIIDYELHTTISREYSEKKIIKVDIVHNALLILYEDGKIHFSFFKHYGNCCQSKTIINEETKFIVERKYKISSFVVKKDENDILKTKVLLIGDNILELLLFSAILN